MKKLLLLAIVVLTGVLLAWLFKGGRELTVSEQACIDEAYKKCEQSIKVEADELEKWYLSYCNSHTAAAAADLTGWRAKWQYVTKSEEEMKQYTTEVLTREMYSEEDCKNRILYSIAHVSTKWVEVEDELAIQTKCYQLSSQAKAEEIKAHQAQVADEHVREQIIRSLEQEAISLVGGEIATAVAVQLATSAGILGAGGIAAWETFGIGLVVGVVVDCVVGWIMDPSGKLQAKLDEQVRSTAASQKELFIKAMMTALESRRKEWEAQISKI